MSVTLEYIGARAATMLGSMQAGSYQLVLESDNHPFLAGHTVIVPVGGEAGAGARATVGVGGTWPATSFPDVATLLATWTHPATTDGSSPAAYAVNTGDVYYWNGSAIVQPATNQYHQRKYWPKALVAVIEAVNGATLTLDTAAVVATSNVRVHIDCMRVMQDAVHTAGLTLEIPESVYALGSRVVNQGGSAMGTTYSEDLTLFGHGVRSEFWAPKGCPSPAFLLASAHRMTATDFVIRSNVSHEAGLLGVEGYGTGDAYRRPWMLSQCIGAEVERVTVIGCEWGGLELTGCLDSNMRNCRAEFPTSRHYYLGVWAMQLTNGTNCHTYDCEVDSDFLCTAAEVFRCTDCSHTRLRTRNGQIASNSSVRSFYNDLEMTIEANSARPLDYDPDFAVNSTVVIDWNKNASSSPNPEGGGVRGLTFRQTGEIGGGFRYAWVFARAGTLDPAGEVITVEGADIQTNGFMSQGAISAIAGPGGVVPQRLNLSDIVCDARIDHVGGEIADCEGPLYRYDPDSIVLGPNLNFTSIQAVL